MTVYINKTIHLNDQLEGIMGLSHKLLFYCSLCDCDKYFAFNECKTDNIKQVRNLFQANIPLVIEFREIGQGYSSIESICCMNIHSTFTSSNGYLIVP